MYDESSGYTLPKPKLSSLKNSWFPNPLMPVFDLKKFLRHGDVEEEKYVFQNGRFSKSGSVSRVDSVEKWEQAMLALGRHLEDCVDVGFLWQDFTLYIEIVKTYFSGFTFMSVLNYDRMFRQWRRGRGGSWVDDNHVLRSTCLMASKFKQATVPGGGKNV